MLFRSIVKHILGAHERELMVESTPGRGSTFGFTLPVGDANVSTVSRDDPQPAAV